MERKTLSGIKGTKRFLAMVPFSTFSPHSIAEVSSTCFELLLASFIQLECSSSSSSPATAESWVNERVLEKIGAQDVRLRPIDPYLNLPFQDSM